METPWKFESSQSHFANRESGIANLASWWNGRHTWPRTTFPLGVRVQVSPTLFVRMAEPGLGRRLQPVVRRFKSGCALLETWQSQVYRARLPPARAERFHRFKSYRLRLPKCCNWKPGTPQNRMSSDVDSPLRHRLESRKGECRSSVPINRQPATPKPMPAGAEPEAGF